MAPVRRHIEVVLERDAAERATKAARHALLTCALAFEGSRRRDVLFAVARSYTAAGRALQSDCTRAPAIVAPPNAHFVCRQLETVEDRLCAAAHALPQIGRRAVRPLTQAAQTYSEAWEFDRA